MGLHSESNRIAEANAEYQELIADLLPRTFDSATGWEFWATALIARCASILDSISALVGQGRKADAEVALRSLYEHVTTLCWIGIDPDQNFITWREGSEAMWIVFDDDARRDFGKGVLNKKSAASFSRKKLKPLEQLADDVDDHWPDVIPAFRRHPLKGKDMRSFRGLYTVIYRVASRAAHAEVDSLQANVRVKRSWVLVTTKEPTEFGRAARAIPLIAYALLVYSHFFRWPGEEWSSQTIDALNYEP